MKASETMSVGTDQEYRQLFSPSFTVSISDDTECWIPGFYMTNFDS